MGKSSYDRIDLLTASLDLSKTAADALTKGLRAFVRQAYQDDEKTIYYLRDDQIQECATDFLGDNDLGENDYNLPLPEAMSQDKLKEVLLRIIRRQRINLRNMRNRQPKFKTSVRRRSTKRQPNPHDFHPATIGKPTDTTDCDIRSDDDDDSSNSDNADDADDADDSDGPDDFDDFDGMLDPGDRSDDHDFTMSEPPLSASPEPVRSRPRRLDRKFAGPTAEKRKAEDIREGANKRPRGGYGSTETTASPTKVLKGDGEWARVLKRYLKDCKYSLERDLTDLRFEPAQEILSRPLGRGSDPMPYLIMIAREARFNLRHFEDNARNTVYILKISVHGVDKTQSLESTFKIIRKGFTYAAAKQAFLGWHFDQPDDPSVTYGVPIDIPITESVCSFLSLKTGTASVPCSHPATPVVTKVSDTCTISKLGGRDYKEDMVLDPESTVPGRQTVSHSKEQGPNPGVRGTIVVRNPVTKDISHSATTSTHDGGKKVSPATIGSLGHVQRQAVAPAREHSQ